MKLGWCLKVIQDKSSWEKVIWASLEWNPKGLASRVVWWCWKRKQLDCYPAPLALPLVASCLVLHLKGWLLLLHCRRKETPPSRIVLDLMKLFTENFRMNMIFFTCTMVNENFTHEYEMLTDEYVVYHFLQMPSCIHGWCFSLPLERRLGYWLLSAPNLDKKRLHLPPQETTATPLWQSRHLFLSSTVYFKRIEAISARALMIGRTSLFFLVAHLWK
jgi:hypothetical protein